MKFCTNCGNKIESESKFCTNCGSELKAGNSKKDKIYGKEKNKFKFVNLIIVVIFGAAIFTYFATQQTKEEKIIGSQPEVNQAGIGSAAMNLTPVSSSIEAGNISISLADLERHKFVSFVYNGINGSVPLLAYINDNGKVITAVRMCEPCNSESFHTQANTLVCDACGTTWQLNNLEAVSGSCGNYPPDPVPSKIADGKILIDESVVINWTRRV